MKKSYFLKSFISLLFFTQLLSFTIAKDDREKWQEPDRVLEVIGIKPGMKIGEPGAGKGFYTFRLARIVGNSGRVYANDIIESYLDSIKKRAQEEGLTNIVTIKGEVEDPLFPRGQLDMVFMSYVLHDLERPVSFLIHMKPSLKSGAPLVILEQAPEKTGSSWHFWKQEKILSTVNKAGYRLDRIETFLPKDNIYFFFKK